LHRQTVNSWRNAIDRQTRMSLSTTIFGNPLADPLGTRRGPPLVRGPQFENRCCRCPIGCVACIWSLHTVVYSWFNSNAYKTRH